MSAATILSPEIPQSDPNPNGPEAREGRDVFMAVRNLRRLGDTSAESPISPERDINFSFGGGQFSGGDHSEVMIDEDEGDEDESDTLAKLRASLKKSNDGGNTLDLSRRNIRQIGPQAVEIFRKGVGQDKKGVWRSVFSL
jgi:hypothetical protein